MRGLIAALVLVAKADAEAGTAGRETAGADAPMLMVWARAAGIEAGDLLVIVIKGPAGRELVVDTWHAEQARIGQFRYAGRRRPVDGWTPGAYIGHVILNRVGRPPRARSVAIRIAERP